MPIDSEQKVPEDWEGFSRQCIFSGLPDLNVGDEPEIDLGNGFSLMKPNEQLLSARWKYSMTEKEYAEGATASRYLVYKQERSIPKTWQEIKDVFFVGLLALQIVKPVRSLGIVFCGEYGSDGSFSLQLLERRPPMEPGPWALKKPFDQTLLQTVPSAIESIQQIMKGPSAEKRNAFLLLQLGLEHFHPLIAGLLWITGLEAVFDSGGKEKFKKKLCKCLGCNTLVFPDWTTQRCDLTVQDVAIDMFVLRNKLAHGADLRKAALDLTYPVDLIEKRSLTNSSSKTPYALLLSEAACYLLCQVLQKEIGLSVGYQQI